MTPATVKHPLYIRRWLVKLSFHATLAQRTAMSMAAGSWSRIILQ